MSISIESIKDEFRILHAGLAQLGFDKRKPGIMTIKKSNDVYGWIGLNTATRGKKGYFEINPVVGIRNQKIEKLVADLLGERFNEVVPPTLA